MKEMHDVLYGKETWDVYRNFKIITKKAQSNNELYKYFDEFLEMLDSEKSHIKLRGFIIICKLSKWDKDNKINQNMDKLLTIFDEKKPTIIRMSLSSLRDIIEYKPDLLDIILNKIKLIDCDSFKDSMSPLIKKDIERIINGK